MPDTTAFDLGRILEIVRMRAAQFGVTQDSLDDCAIEFAECMWKGTASRTLQPDDACSGDKWLRACARNHVVSYLRKRARLTGNEVALIDAVLECNASNSADDPEASALIAEIDNLLLLAIDALTPQQAEVVAARNIDSKSVNEIAAATGRSPDAVSKLLARSRIRLRRWLEVRGLAEEDIPEYLAAIQRGGRGGIAR